MEDGPPPPPPPHGTPPKSSGLPPGNYDIFIIPPHASGSGFLYLPSLQPNVNSFVAGFASCLVVVALTQILKPLWGILRGGGPTTLLLMIAIGLMAWSLGRMQNTSGSGTDEAPGGVPPNGGAYSGAHNTYSSGSTPNGGPRTSGFGTGSTSGAGGPPPGQHAGAGARQRAGSTWEQDVPPSPGAGSYSPGANSNADTQSNASAKSAWERARAETKKKEDERKRQEEERAKQAAEKKRKLDLEKRLRELREKEARERQDRERKQREDEDRRREGEGKRRKEEEARKAAAMREEETRRRELQAKIDAEAKLRAERIAAEAKAKAEKAEAEARARVEKEKADEEAKAKAEKSKADAKAWATAKATAKARAEAKAKEAKELAAAAAEQRKSSTYAYSAVGEKFSPWPNGKPPAIPRSTPASPASPAAYSAAKPAQATPTSMPAQPSSIPKPAQPPSPTKNPPPPSAHTYAGTENDPHSYRPYGNPTPKPARKKSIGSLYSDSSYAASQSTHKTTPPASTRGPYSTKDPDKIVIKAVYAFNNAFHKTPTSQLVSNVGTVTDGLILRITTEGLFIDDDVRGIPQREWDVKAWTMKLVEVWCPNFRQAARAPPSSSVAHKNPVRRLWGLDKELAASEEEKDALLVSMLQLCRDNCRMRSNSTSAASVTSSVYSASSYASSSDARSSVSSDYASSVDSSASPSESNEKGNKKGRTNQNTQMGESKSAGLHLLRASIRDQEGRKYVFVISESESWKVSMGLQRLRRGTQVRSLGVSGMSVNDTKSTLENLGYL